jgi:chlorite dismutase
MSAAPTPSKHAAAGEAIPISLEPTPGLHCSHFYYRWDRAALADWTEDERLQAAEEFVGLFGPVNHEPALEGGAADDDRFQDWPARTQLGLVAGDKADFSLMVMDKNPLRVEQVHQSLLASRLGVCLEPVYSFVSLSEISEYVPTVEQFAEKLQREGGDPGSAEFQARVRGYAERLPGMNRHRICPAFPDWPVTCFYPMNKRRDPGANWFALPFSARQELMAEHARSGIHFMGKVTQLITVGIGLEDWEWGVTLWAKNPMYLKEIVYQMRFDQASALYAEFGPFYTSYVMSPLEILRRCFVVPV